MRYRPLLAWACAFAVVTGAGGAAAQPFAYVANLGSDDVSVVDAAGLETVATLPAGDDPDGVAVSPDGRRAFASGFLSDSVTILDTRSNQVLAVVPVGAGPVGLAVTPDGTRVYVAQRGADSVAAIGVASGTVEAVIPVGRGPNAVAVTPDGRTAFVTNSFAPLAGEVSVLDLAGDRVRSTITVGRKPNRVAVTPDGRTAYVTNFRSWTSTAIDVASETVRTTFRAGHKSTGVAVNPNGVWAYVTDAYRGELLVIDVAADQVTRALPLGGSPSGIGILRHGATAYVSDFAEDVVHVVDLADEALVADVGVGTRPFAVAVNCIDDACRDTPYTPKPTRTATETPTPTPTPSRTYTPTSTASATTTRTLAAGLSHALLALTAEPTTAGAPTRLSLELQPGGQSVSGIRELVGLPFGLSVAGTGEALDCALAPHLAAAMATFTVLADACGVFCDALSVSIDFDQPLVDPTVLYTCTLNQYVDLPIGTLRLRQLDATALDADGGALPSRGRDAILVIAPPPTPSPDLTPRPTRTPTQAPRPEVFVAGNPLIAIPGERATLTVHLATGGHAIAGVQNDIELPPGLTIAAGTGGRPACTVNPDIDKNGTAFSFQPPGCAPGPGCTGIRAIVLSFDGSTPIVDGATLYRCALLVGADLTPGAYALTITNTAASTPGGAFVEAGGFPIAVTVQGGASLRRAGAATARVCAGGEADGDGCADDTDCEDGICVVAQGVCDGGTDDGLLCDCPGGRCVAGDSSCGGTDAGRCADGVADGACCDRAFACRDGSACTASQRLCAGGPAKGSPCLNDAQCLGSACLVSRRRCAGGAFAGVACIDAADCAAGSCLDPLAPTPTAEPIETIPPLTAHADGCTVVAPRGGASAWWLGGPLLILLARRGTRRPRR